VQGSWKQDKGGKRPAGLGGRYQIGAFSGEKRGKDVADIAFDIRIVRTRGCGRRPSCCRGDMTVSVFARIIPRRTRGGRWPSCFKMQNTRNPSDDDKMEYRVGCVLPL
jgi:hypothetical protein